MRIRIRNPGTLHIYFSWLICLELFILPSCRWLNDLLSAILLELFILPSCRRLNDLLSAIFHLLGLFLTDSDFVNRLFLLPTFLLFASTQEKLVISRLCGVEF
jgi:hypothetical protein